MELFVVTKCGIVSRQLAGVFSCEDKARDAAVQLLEKERDDYHRYECHRVYLNDVVKMTPVVAGRGYRHGGEFEERKPLWALVPVGRDVYVRVGDKERYVATMKELEVVHA